MGPEPVTVALSWTVEPMGALVTTTGVPSPVPEPRWISVTVELVSLLAVSGSQAPVEESRAAAIRRAVSEDREARDDSLLGR